jgi:hypothetical protein
VEKLLTASELPEISKKTIALKNISEVQKEVE